MLSNRIHWNGKPRLWLRLTITCLVLLYLLQDSVWCYAVSLFPYVASMCRAKLFYHAPKYRLFFKQHFTSGQGREREHLFVPWCYPRWTQLGLPPHLDRTDNNRGKHLYRKSGASVCGQCQHVLLSACASSELSYCQQKKFHLNTQPWMQEADIACTVEALKFWGFFSQKMISN